MILIRGGWRAGRRRPDWLIYFAGDPQIDGCDAGAVGEVCMTRCRVAKIEHDEGATASAHHAYVSSLQMELVWE